MEIVIPATLEDDECVAVTEVPTRLHSIVKLPIVAVQPVDTTVKSLGSVKAIFPLLSLFGKVYTVVTLKVKLHEAPI